MLEFELWVYRGLIVVLGACLVYFIRGFIVSVKELKDEVKLIFEEVKTSINSLNTNLIKEQLRQDNVVSVLTKHEDTLCTLKKTANQHDKEIAVIKEKLK